MPKNIYISVFSISHNDDGAKITQCLRILKYLNLNFPQISARYLHKHFKKKKDSL